MAVLGGDPVFINIPYALSEETLKFLHGLNIPFLATGLPAPEDIVGWSKLQERVERHTVPESDQLVERLAPAIAGFSLGGVPVLDVRPRNWKREHKVAIYIHGGGFTLYSAASTLYRAALFADDTALRVISVDYMLAPLATFEEITNQVVTVVQAILNEGYRMPDIIMLGEDSGASVVVASILRLRNLALKLPAAALLISPCVDISATDETDYVHRNQPVSCITEQFRTQADFLRNPGKRWNVDTAKVYADFFNGFPPTLIQGSTQEIWLNRFFRLYHVLDVNGAEVRLDLYEEVPHGFQFGIPAGAEAQLARRKMREFARVQLAQEERPSMPGKSRRAILEISRVGNNKGDRTDQVVVPHQDT